MLPSGPESRATQCCEADLHNIPLNWADPELIPLPQLCLKSRSNQGGDHSSWYRGLWEAPGTPQRLWTWRGEARTQALHQCPPWDKPPGGGTGSRRSLLWCHTPLSCSEKGGKHSVVTERDARSDLLLYDLAQILSQSITGRWSQPRYATFQVKYQKEMKVGFWPLKRDAWHHAHLGPSETSLGSLCLQGYWDWAESTTLH